MKKKLYDLILFCATFVLLSDISGSVLCYEMGIFRFLIPVLAAAVGSTAFILAHKTPIDRSWKGIFDVALDILLMGCAFLGMGLLDLWGFVNTSFFPQATAEGFNFLTTSWIIYFVMSLLIRITLIIEKLFHWWERRNIKLKMIE